MKSKIRKIKITEPGRHLIELKKEHETVEVMGVFKVKKNESLAVEVIIHHLVPSVSATTILKGVAEDEGKLSIKGTIIINQNCHQSNSFLTERVLLLSDQASVEITPDLEILTDDVSCSHAASISNLNKSQLFYLMSRGLSEKAAEKLIVDGFLKT